MSRPGRPPPAAFLLAVFALAGAGDVPALAPGPRVALVSAPLADEAAPRPRYAGLSLGAALRLLQAQGLEIVFTDLVVPPDLKVPAEPTATVPRQVLDEILAPHGLAVREEGGLLVVVPGAERAAIRGRVITSGGDGPPPGAVVRLLETGRTAPLAGDGGFIFDDLPPGPYTLEATASRYLDLRLERVMAAPASPPLVLVLQPQPVLREEVLVRPSRLSLLDESADAGSFTLSRDEIDRLPQLGGDVFRATTLLPGIAAADISAQFSVRGGRPDEVKILLDGQELYGAFHLQDYDNALSVVPARLLASASLTTGALPASQGDRMSGLLDLRTVDPPGGRQYVLGLSVFDVLASTAGGFADGNGGWLLTGRRGSLALAERAIGPEDAQFWDVLGKAERTTRAGRFSLNVLATGDAFEVDAVEGEDVERLANEYRTEYAWATHETGTRRLLLRTGASWSRLEHDRGGSVAEEKGEFELRDRRLLRALGLSQTATLHLAADSLEWGWEAHRYDVSFDYAHERHPDIVILGQFAAARPTERRFRGDRRSDHIGVWARDVRAWGSHLTTDLGLRYDQHTGTDDELLSPRLSLGWRIGQQAILRAAWGRFFQTQRPYELEVGDGETELHRAERSDQWILGYEVQPMSSRLRVAALRLELYHRQVDHPRQRFESLLEPVNVFPEIEPDRARIVPSWSIEQGVELLVRGERTARSGWWITYTRALAEDRIEGRDVPRRLDQPSTLTAVFDRRVGRHWQLALAWRWHSGWPTTPVFPLPPAGPDPVPDPEPDDPGDEPDEPGDEPDEPGEPDEPPDDDAPAVAVFGELASERLSPYHRLDLRASRQWQLARGTLGFFVDVQNVYARRNLAGFDVTLDDAGGVAIKEERWPAIVPSLGITWQFGR